MSDPVNFEGEALPENNLQFKEAVKLVLKNKVVLIFAAILVIVGAGAKLMDSQPVFFVHAYASTGENESKIKPLPLSKELGVFSEKNAAQNRDGKKDPLEKILADGAKTDFAEKLYVIVGDAPIKEMVPFIAKRDSHTAAFLVAIAKKESGLGEHSPSLNGQDCYNYWGYKGSAGRGTSMGYACFASAEEAVETVGNRIDVLVNKNRTTPASMVHTWKCGTSCKGDPGAPGWVATVAMYFDKIMG